MPRFHTQNLQREDMKERGLFGKIVRLRVEGSGAREGE